jgi:crotonobetaine/carnitine-CoA ligase
LIDVAMLLMKKKELTELNGGFLGSGVNNLANLISQMVRRSPDANFGTVGELETFAHTFRRAASIAETLRDLGISAGQCIAVIGSTSSSYLLTWLALQLAGVQAALLNPSYPAELLDAMVGDLQADALLWVGMKPDPHVGTKLLQLDMTNASRGWIGDRDGNRIPLVAAGDDMAGSRARLADIAGYIHTSGTSGRPKFCALSHEYFLRLGRLMADRMDMTSSDTVFAPLPMFHINPLGYGVIGALTAGASLIGWEKFSARNFWKTVVGSGATTLILHMPPIEILKKSTAAADAEGHRVRVAFCGDPGFLEQFGISQGISCYGSTEGGGASHMWKHRPGDRLDVPEGMNRFGGQCRYDVERTLSSEGEILLREKSGIALFSGYRRNGAIEPACDSEGWFHTGDLGRLDEWGNLIFVERLSESIRVKGEYVPIDYVERRLKQLDELGDFVIWRRPAQLGGDEVVIYATGEVVPISEIRLATQDLPNFMKPVAVILVSHLPRDTGVGKVQRRLLSDLPAKNVIALG